MRRRGLTLSAWLAACTACSSMLLAGHPVRDSVDLYPYGAQGSSNVTFWKNVVYVGAEGYSCSANTLHSVDVSDPYNLRHVDSSGSDTCKANEVKVVEDVLYCASWSTSLRVWGVNDGYCTWRWDYFANAAAYTLDVAYQRAYVGAADGYVPANDGVYIIDVSNPDPPDPNATLISKIPSAWGGIGGIVARGSYLYFADTFDFVIANISDEQHPVVVSRRQLNPFRGGELALRGDLAFLTGGGNGVALYVFDVSNPLDPRQIGQCLDVAEGGNMYLMGDRAFLACGGGGLVTVNIADPTDPRVVALTHVPLWPGTNNAWEASVTGNGRYIFLGGAENYPHTPTQDNYTRGAVFSLEVFDQDVDDTGPTSYSDCSLGEASWDTQYEADALPTASAPTWQVLEGAESWAGAADGVLRINDTGTATGERIRWWRNWDGTYTRGGTVLFRARCASCQAVGSINNVSVETGKHIEDFAILPDRIRANRSGLEYALDGTQWHTYRITVQAAQFKVYVDEGSSPILTGSLTAATQRARIMFGSGSAASKQDISFDSLHCFSGGPVAPPPALTNQTPDFSVKVADVAGKGSLSGINPATARVHWSTDGGATWSASGGSIWDGQYDCGAMPVAANPAWSFLEGTETIASVNAGVLRIIDASTASGSKVKWLRSWGAVPAVGTTILARARCTAVGGDTTYLGNLFVEDGVYAEQFKIMTDRIEVGSGLSYALDGTQWHLYRITTRNDQFTVYVDENPVAVMTGTMTATTAANRMMIGSGASAGTQDIEFDYVHYGAVGDFAPGQTLSNSVPVTCTGAVGDDRGFISAYGVPFNQPSQTMNKLRFSLRDLAGNTGYSPVYNVRILGASIPDYNNDGDVDQEDFGHLQGCFSGGDLRSPGCEDADLNFDLAVNEEDFTLFLSCMAGPGQAPFCSW